MQARIDLCSSESERESSISGSMNDAVLSLAQVLELSGRRLPVKEMSIIILRRTSVAVLILRPVYGKGRLSIDHLSARSAREGQGANPLC